MSRLMTLFLSTSSARRTTAALAQNIRRGIFLSTSSARRTTPWKRSIRRWTSYFYPRPPRGGRHPPAAIGVSGFRYFYPRPPRGGRPGCCLYVSGKHRISIHVLREEDDLITQPHIPAQFFISIHVLREEDDRIGLLEGLDVIVISIHVLREEDDGWTGSGRRDMEHFYPRPPRGGRQ